MDDEEIMAFSLVGYFFGVILAMVISWSLNHGILWAILHGALSWAYVIYYAIFLR